MPVASCHCGAVRAEVARRPAELTSCNCSGCRYGALWAYYTLRDACIDVAADALVAYGWDDKTLDFIRCGGCGCVVYWLSTRDKGGDTRIGVNARMFDPAEIEGLRIRHLDGAESWKFLD